MMTSQNLRSALRAVQNRPITNLTCLALVDAPDVLAFAARPLPAPPTLITIDPTLDTRAGFTLSGLMFGRANGSK